MSEVRSMTYAEIAVALGIGADSARNLVRRKRWHRKPGNDGLARIDVPIEHLRGVEGTADAPTIPPTDGHTGAPTRMSPEQFALSVLAEHVRRCEAEIERLKHELGSAREHGSERDMLAAQIAGLGAVIHELRSDRNHWRDQAQRLSLVMPPPRRSPWVWAATGLFRSRERSGRSPDPVEPGRSARQAAHDAGLIPADRTRAGAISPLDPDGPELSVSDLEHAIERLAAEVDPIHDTTR